MSKRELDVQAHAEAAPEAQQLIEGPGPERRRWSGRLALATGAAACLGALAILRWTSSRPEATLENLRQPFRLYDTSKDPNLLAMPSRSDQYDGVEDKRGVKIVDKDDGSVSIFVIGDWGATLPNHQTFGAQGGDMYAQMSVADAVKKVAAKANPQYVLNVGDNFYVQGLEHSCNDPPDAVKGAGSGAFSSGWQQVYGPVANIPWLSVLGNHDYGGWRMDRGWPQQIGYSFINYNWVMPARYFNKKIQHKDFLAEYFMIDSNAYDAKNPGEEPDHNICSQHNYGGAGTCANNGGMPNIGACRDWFWQSHAKQKQWLEEKLAASKADWKVVVTHFPCGYDGDMYKMLKAKHGLDLLVTGHRHQQELWKIDTENDYVQGFLHTNNWDGSAPACFVTGGGGGISSQHFGYAKYEGDLKEYGFFHLTMHKDWMNIELVGIDGETSGSWKIYPHGSEGARKQAAMKLKDLDSGLCASFCGDSNNPWTKVCSWMSCVACKGCQEPKGNTSNSR